MYDESASTVERQQIRMTWAAFLDYARQIGWKEKTLELLGKGKWIPRNPVNCGIYRIEIAREA